MLTEPYFADLLVDEELADEIWELWDVELISDDLAATTWTLIDCACYVLRRVAAHTDLKSAGRNIGPGHHPQDPSTKTT